MEKIIEVLVLPMKKLSQRWLETVNLLQTALIFQTINLFPRNACLRKLFPEYFDGIFWKKNPSIKLQVRWKVTMPFEVECNCGKSVYQIWSKPYWTSVRRKKLECCGQMAVGRVPCPRSVLQLNSIFRNERAFVHCAKGGASSCGILYRQ